MLCQLCRAGASQFLYNHWKEGDYYHCQNCDLRYLDPQFYVSLEKEKDVYLTHENDVDSPEYQDFMRPIFEKVKSIVKTDDKGLDYGCGPGPALAKMLNEAGYQVNIYDPIFYNDPKAIQTTYDYVICTEVIEHFKEPIKEFLKLKELLKPDGILAMMTLIYNSKIDFANWHYRRDPTHVSFYSATTLEKLCSSINMELMYSDNHRIVIFKNH
jgi:hypothetical protein